MGYRLRKGVSYCIAGGYTVFFDLPKCRYSALPRDIDVCFQALASGGSAHTERLADLANLVDSGLLVFEHALTTDVVCVPALPVASSLIDADRPSARVTGVLAAIAAQARASLNLKVHRLETIFANLKEVRRPRGTPVLPSREQLCDICSSFYWSQRLISSGVKCLRRSVALAGFLSRRGIECSLVIGVRMRPFAAHAWVQHGDIVLNESLDEARRYTPILVV